MIEKSVAFLGGDKRQLFAAKTFADSGYKVYLSGFDKLESFGNLVITDINTAIENSSIVVFPVIGVKGRKIPVYFSNSELNLTEDILNKLEGKIVFSGKSESIKRLNPFAIVYDYLNREEFAVANALPTAEGAIQIAMENYEGTINGCKCLVIGYGRIGKVLSRTLNNLKAYVTVSARKQEHYKEIKADGNTAVDTNSITGLKGYDVVFNTVPKLVIYNSILENTDKDTIIIDLASLPGGVDYSKAEQLNITTIQALSLPGKCSPKTAGKIICETIFNILKEEYRWQKLI